MCFVSIINKNHFKLAEPLPSRPIQDLNASSDDGNLSNLSPERLQQLPQSDSPPSPVPSIQNDHDMIHEENEGKKYMFSIKAKKF